MKWLTILIIVSLSGFFFYSENIPYFQFNEEKPSGTLISTQGVVMGRSNNQESFKNLKVNSPLLHSNKVKTGIKSSCIIEFGETFKVLSNTSLDLINIGNRYEVHVLSGEIERQKLTTKTDFFVNNKKINIQNIKYEPNPPLKDSHLNERVKVEANPPLNSATPTPLQNTFKLHQRFLEKCFIKHYERSQGHTQEGLILTEFNIDKKGNLNSIVIKKSDYTDEKFHACIRDVISRVQLKQQKTEVLKVEFPIQVTLPL